MLTNEEQYALILRVRDGDREAFGLIYKSYFDALHRFANYRISNEEDRDDILGKVFAEVFDTLRQGKEVRDLRAYFYQVLRNIIFDYYKERRLVREKEIELGEAGVERVRDNAALNPEEKIDREIDYQRALKHIGRLREEQREVIQLRFFEELEISEIAIVMNKSHVGARVLLHRALEALKKAYYEDSRTDSTA